MKKSILILAIMVLFTTLLTAQENLNQTYFTFETKFQTTVTAKDSVTIKKAMAVTVTCHKEDVIITIYNRTTGSYKTYICYMMDVWDDNMYVMSFNNKYQIFIYDFESIEVISADKNGKEKYVIYK